MFIVRARPTLAEGTPVMGYLTPPSQSDWSLGVLQPTAIVASGQVSLWCGTLAPGPEEIAARYARLGRRSAAQVFSLRFESEVEWVGGPITGTVPGFVAIEDLRTMQVRVVT